MAWPDWLPAWLRRAPEPVVRSGESPVSQPLAEFLKAWEGCSLTPYRDAAGLWTCGYGHLLLPNEPREPWTRERADEQLRRDIASKAADVAAMVYAPLRPFQIDALVSFAFNLGSGALKGSTLLRCVNKGEFPGAAAEFAKWRNARDPNTGRLVVLEGLVKRREAERRMWLFGDYTGRP